MGLKNPPQRSKSKHPANSGRILFDDGTIETTVQAATAGRVSVPDEIGLAPRRAAIAVIEAVMQRAQSLTDALEAMPSDLSGPDAAFARAIAMGALRRSTQIDEVIKVYLAKPLPAGSGLAPLILHAAAAELLVLEAAPHAAVDCANKLAALDKNGRHFRGLINAVLRKVAGPGRAVFANLDGPRLNTPPWAWEDWAQSYGEATARAIAEAHLKEAPIDFSVKNPGEAKRWAEALEAQILPTGTLRRAAGGRIEALPGFVEGAWWVQDAAAALPVKLLGDVKGKTVIDLCAAPGGKTAQLAAAGASVTAVDRSGERLRLLQNNLKRLKLEASVVAADALTWRPNAPADAVLLDAPCTATGTIRRHPDILLNKARGDVFRLAEDQVPLLEAALAKVKPGGMVVYSVCSLQPEEGIAVVERVLCPGKAAPFAQRIPLRRGEIAGLDEFIDSNGDLRTLPCHWPELGGMDGFYAARLKRLPV
jgi:16S rRNA (cytosine967-C5)-methyltransferase